MKLYYSPGACSLSPHITLREAGLDFDLVRVNLKTHTYGDQQDFYQVNQQGSVPAIELVDGTVIKEAAVVLQYIGDKATDKKLIPAFGGLERYRLQEWLNYLSTDIHKSFSPLFHVPRDNPYRETVKNNLFKRYQWIDQQLGQKDYLMGTFGVADTYLFAMTNWAQASWQINKGKLDFDLSELNHLKDWYLRVYHRPHVQAALKAEGLIT
jgi:glutathione S-transferase